jgi:hypothetical protein
MTNWRDVGRSADSLFNSYEFYHGERKPMTPKMVEQSRARMNAIALLQQAMRDEESGAAIGIADEVLNALATCIVLAIECKGIDGLRAEWRE